MDYSSYANVFFVILLLLFCKCNFQENKKLNNEIGKITEKDTSFLISKIKFLHNVDIHQSQYPTDFPSKLTPLSNTFEELLFQYKLDTLLWQDTISTINVFEVKHLAPFRYVSPSFNFFIKDFTNKKIKRDLFGYNTLTLPIYNHEINNKSLFNQNKIYFNYLINKLNYFDGITYANKQKIMNLLDFMRLLILSHNQYVSGHKVFRERYYLNGRNMFLLHDNNSFNKLLRLTNGNEVVGHIPPKKIDYSNHDAKELSFYNYSSKEIDSILYTIIKPSHHYNYFPLCDTATIIKGKRFIKNNIKKIKNSLNDKKVYYFYTKPCLKLFKVDLVISPHHEIWINTTFLNEKIYY